jgi:hypothetical protein
MNGGTVCLCPALQMSKLGHECTYLSSLRSGARCKRLPRWFLGRRSIVFQGPNSSSRACLAISTVRHALFSLTWILFLNLQAGKQKERKKERKKEQGQGELDWKARTTSATFNLIHGETPELRCRYPACAARSDEQHEAVVECSMRSSTYTHCKFLASRIGLNCF